VWRIRPPIRPTTGSRSSCPSEPVTSFRRCLSNSSPWHRPYRIAVMQAERDESRRHDCLTTAERQELVRLQCDIMQLRPERQHLELATARISG